MEFLSLSRRRSSSRNVPQRRWARRNVCRSQAIKWKGREICHFCWPGWDYPTPASLFLQKSSLISDCMDGQQLIKAKLSIPRVTGKFPRSVSNVTSTTRFFNFDTHGLLDWTFLKAKYCANLARSLAGKQLIMVIELSGVQFGLKSYAWFQNRTSAQREFDLKSQVWFQTKIARHEVQLPLYYFHFEIAEFSQY